MTIAIAAIGVAGSADRQGTRPDPPTWQAMATTEAEMRARAATAGGAQPPRPVVIEFSRVTKSYPSGDVGVDDVSFTVRRGEFVFLVRSTRPGKHAIKRPLMQDV